MKWARAIVLGALAGCASVDVDEERVPLCGALESFQVLPEVGSCSESELLDYASAVSDRVVKSMSRALVRIEFDDAARARLICVEAANSSDAWSERRYLAARPDAIANLPRAPGCLAGRRLDLNRYEATLAEIDQAGTLCAGQGAHFYHCMELHGDWIVRDRIGWTRPFVFAAPEIANPPDLFAIDTVSRCWRTAAHPFEPQAACIQAEGWEMLAPPPR